MTNPQIAQLPKPDWYDRPPSEWPPEARTVFGILAEIAGLRLQEEAEQRARAAGQAA